MFLAFLGSHNSGKKNFGSSWQRPHTAKSTRKLEQKKSHFWLKFSCFRIQHFGHVGWELILAQKRHSFYFDAYSFFPSLKYISILFEMVPLFLLLSFSRVAWNFRVIILDADNIAATKDSFCKLVKTKQKQRCFLVLLCALGHEDRSIPNVFRED